MDICTRTGTSEATRPLKLKMELQALMVDRIWVLRIELGPSARAEYILNHGLSFPAPRGIYITCTDFVHVTVDGTQGFVLSKHIPSHWTKAPTLNNLKHAASILTLNIYTRKQKHLYILNWKKVHLHYRTLNSFWKEITVPYADLECSQWGQKIQDDI